MNFESPHVHPLDATPGGGKLLIVNTADNRLEVMAIDGDSLLPIGSVPVGLDPISVRARSDHEAWVVNHISDSISVVDLDALTVRATIATGDEPADVIFAGNPLRAFVTVSQLNEVRVFDPDDLSADPTVIPIEGEDPRALATDGQRVYAAIFESGNKTSIVLREFVSSTLSPYPLSPNPPPNAGNGFSPPINPALPTPPQTSLIVQKQPDGSWRDESGADWSAAVPWDVHGHDIAVIDTNSLSVSYVTDVLNLNMSLAVNAAGGVLVVGTLPTNLTRFEPNVRGTFVRVGGAALVPGSATPLFTFDLNQHLDYSTPTVPQEVRNQSIGDPRGVVWSPSADRFFVSGMGSNNVGVFFQDGSSVRIDVGEGPTGLALRADRLYVLNRFEGSISIIDINASTELDRVGFFDPTPPSIRLGRRHLYGTHETSGLGQASCASCHVDARTDGIAWDLGDPSGEMHLFDQGCAGECEDWHPMKGPMVTQSLMGIIGTEPFHWRGDRASLADFNPAFVSLMGAEELTGEEMGELTAFVASLTNPPNPYRNIDGSLRSSLPSGGNPVAGELVYTTAPVLGSAKCNSCHVLPLGTASFVFPHPGQQMNVPHIRSAYEKTGFSRASSSNNSGFGIFHDGGLGFADLGSGMLTPEQLIDVTAFVFSMSTDTHAGVGVQATIDGTNPEQVALRDELLETAGQGEVAMTVKGPVNGEQRGFYFLGSGTFQSDRADEIFTLAQLDAVAAPGAELTYTLVPIGSEIRIGVDRDQDGFFDRDERDACSNPADPKSVPIPGQGCPECPGDINADDIVDVNDLVSLIVAWGVCPAEFCPADTNDDGVVDVTDLVAIVLSWGACE